MTAPAGSGPLRIFYALAAGAMADIGYRFSSAPR